MAKKNLVDSVRDLYNQTSFKLEDRSKKKKALDLLVEGKVEEAIKTIEMFRYLDSKLTFSYLQLKTIFFATIWDSDTVFEFYEDREKYERTKALIGFGNDKKMILFNNPETGEVEGFEEIFPSYLPKNYLPLLDYYQSLKNLQLQAQTT